MNSTYKTNTWVYTPFRRYIFELDMYYTNGDMLFSPFALSVGKISAHFLSPCHGRETA